MGTPGLACSPSDVSCLTDRAGVELGGETPRGLPSRRHLETIRMKIVLFGATGNVGQRVIKEALRRGNQVVGVVRDPAAVQSPDPRVNLMRGDATDAASVAAVARGADAVVNAISPRPNPRGLAAPSLVLAARALIGGMKRAGVERLLIVGGAGSLEVAPGKLLVDQPDFPAAYKGEALAQRDALTVYRAEAGELDWTYLSPAAEIHPGERTGRYRVGGDGVLSDRKGRSTISFEDYAVAVLDELEKRQHIRERFTVAY
jgi:putative NADH-flavin reductase